MRGTFALTHCMVVRITNGRDLARAVITVKEKNHTGSCYFVHAVRNDGDLLKWVHLSNIPRMVPSTEPLKDDVAETEAQINAVPYRA